jgi:hypothetical protein
MPAGAVPHESGSGYVSGGIVYPGDDWRAYLAVDARTGRVVSAYRARTDALAVDHARAAASWQGARTFDVFAMTGRHPDRRRRLVASEST